MKSINTLLFCLMFLSGHMLNAQIDGDNLFSTDQVVRIELNFEQTNFWDSLTINYETSTYMKADLILTDVTGAYSFEDVGVRLKGNSSYGHPGNKKSFKIDFNKYVSGQNYDGLKKLNFSNAFKDPTLMREKIFFDVTRLVGVPAPRANYAEVLFNGTPWGFYTLIEQIDDQFLDWKILDDDGNLFKAGSNFGGGGPGGGGNDTEADLRYYGEDQTSYEERYELKSNEDENNWSDLIRFIDFVNNASTSDFENSIGDSLDLDNYLKNIALDNVFANLDSYTNSARNYYIYHNLSTQKWEWIKWDANESFGTYRAGQGINNLTALPLDYRANNRPLLENILTNATFYARYENEVCSIVEEYFNEDYLHARVDELKALIADYVYADNNKMYSNANFDTNLEQNINLGGGGGGGGGGTSYGLKSFVSDRYEYLLNNLNCEISSTGELLTDQIQLFPNPTNQFINVQFEGANSNEDRVLRLFSIAGVLLSEIDLPTTGQNELITLDLSQYSSGIYIVRVFDERGSFISKLIAKK